MKFQGDTSISSEATLAGAPLAAPSPSSQTLVRGLDVLEQVATGPQALNAIARRLGLSRSTVHRLAATLLDRRYLNLAPRRGYSLGPKLLELGYAAHGQISLVRLVRPYLEALAQQTGDVAMLCIRDKDRVLVADHMAGRRRLVPSLRTGDHLDLERSAPGRVMRAAPAASADAMPDLVTDAAESEPDITCIAGAVRGADGAAAAAICLMGASKYLTGGRLKEAQEAVAGAARQASEELGWQVATRHADAGAEQELLGTELRHGARGQG